MALHSPSVIEYILRTSGGVAVVQGPISTWGAVKEVDDEVMTEGGPVVVGARTELRLATGILAPKKDSFLTVDGVRYRAADPRRENDGGETVVVLARAD